MNVGKLAGMAVAAMLLAATAPAANAQVRYNIIDLGTLGSTQSCPFAINNAGQVVGYSQLVEYGANSAFRTAPNQPINAATDVVGGSTSLALNDVGQAVVQATYYDGLHAYRTGPNQRVDVQTDDIGTLGGLSTWGYGINSSGQVVGESNVSGSVVHAFRTGPNQPINPATDDLGTLGGAYSVARGINDSGQVVGYSRDLAWSISHAFRTAPNQAINPATDDIGDLGGTRHFTVARGINNVGEVVGYSYIPGNATSHAFRTAPNQPINPATDDLGTLGGSVSIANSINSFGQVVGFSYLSGDVGQGAFLYTDGVMIDLTNFVPPGSGWLLDEATGINDSGQIAVVGRLNGIRRGFLLTPVPEPATLSLLALGALAMLRRRRTK